MTYHRVDTFLKALGGMPAQHCLFASINQIIQLQHTFEKIVPPQLTKHCVIGKLVNGKLIIYADSGAVAARLKHIVPSLLDKLGSQVISIFIQIGVHNYPKSEINSPSKQKLPLSQIATQNLNQLAQAMPESPLRTAIESLINNCKV